MTLLENDEAPTSAGLKVLQMIDDLRIGGAQKLQVTLAGAAHEHGLSITVVTLKDLPESPIAAELRSLGSRVHTIHGVRLFDARRFGRLFRFLRRERFDVIHTHLLESNVLGGLLGPRTRTPVVGSLHNTEPFAGRYAGAKQWLEYSVLRRRTRRIVAVGQTVADSHAAQLRGARVEVIPNAVNPITPLSPETRNALRTELAGDSNRPVLVALGRLTKQKGFDVLLHAFAEVRRSHPEATLIIAGGGPRRGELEAQIESLGLSGSARMLGSRKDPERLLAAADIFVSSSRWEGMPVVVLEAMAAGLPIVATRVGDNESVLTGGTAILVPPENPLQLAAQLSLLLDRPDLRCDLGARARRHAQREYGAAVWCDRLAAVYAEAAGRKDDG